MPTPKRTLRTLTITAVVATATTSGVANAQNNSLFRQDLPTTAQQQPLTMEQGSWTFNPPPPPPRIQIHDKVSVRVDIKSRVTSEGELQRRKTANYNAVLSDWVRLVGLTAVKPTPMADGDPRMAGSLQQQFRALGELETSESLKYEIAAEVADIRPNGMLVLEAHQSVRNNNEVWEFSLAGLVNPKDIAPGGVVLSRDIVDLRIDKREHGHIRDSYKRGWFVRWLDQFHPF